MSNKNKESVDNASEVIERFGGIRPMSSKTDIPVTTIQGWKKRNSIPAARVEEIMQAAQSHNVDLSGLIEKGSANQNDKPEAVEEDIVLNEVVLTKAASPSQEVKSNVYNSDNLSAQLSQMEAKVVKKSVLISSGFFVVILLAIAALVWPRAQDVNNTLENNSRQIAALEGQVGNSDSGISAKVSDFIPESWQNQIDGWMGQAEQIKSDAIAAKDQAQAALKKVEEISNDVLGANAGTLDQRVQKLGGHYNEVMATPQMAYFMEQIDSIGASVPGREVLSGAQGELSSLLSTFSGTPEQMNAYLDKARQQSASLGQAFDGVPADDMKAAALLFAFNQMRAALNREGQPFDEDLQLLKNFIGDENTALHAAIDRLAPRAQDGVLSVQGLTNEFRDVAGDAVVASLQGEDVSVQEKAKARFNELFSVERDGELVTGTDTQAKLKEVMNLLDEGNLDKAIAKADALQGPEAEAVQPWIEKAKSTKAAEDVKDILGYNIDLRTKDAANIGDAGMSLQGLEMEAGPGNMIYDPKSGLRIYLPSKAMNTP